jgi:autotransporter-associated beta strand protein
MSYTKSGTASTTLSGTNTFTGGVTLNAGKLNINNASALGTTAGTFTITGGTIDNTTGGVIYMSNYPIAWNGDFTYNGTQALVFGTGVVTMNGNRTVTTNIGNYGCLYFGGVIQGAYNFTVTGTGIIQLMANNTYTGTTSLLAGQVWITSNAPSGSAGAFGSSTNAVLLGNTSGSNNVGIYGQAPGLTINRNITVQAGSSGTASIGEVTAGSLIVSGNITLNKDITIYASPSVSTTTISGIISGAYSVIVSGSNTGTTILSGANTYTGSTTIQGGILSVASINSVTGGSGSSNLGVPSSAANGTIAISNGGATSGTLTYTGTGETTDRVISLGGNGLGTTIDQSGTGLLKFTSSFTSLYSGTPRTLTLKGSTAGTGEISGVIINYNSTAKTLVTKAGTGTWTLSGTNTYTGTTTLSAGQLNINNAQALGTAVATTTINGGTIDNTSSADITTLNYPMQWNGDFTYAGSLHNLNLGTGAVTMSANRIITVSSSTLTVGGIIGPASAYTLTKAGTGTLTLGAANIFTGGVTLNAGQLNINNAAALGTTAGTFTISGGTIDNTSTGDITTSNYPISIGADFTYAGSVHNLNLGAGTITMGANRQITVSAQTLTLGGTLSASSYNLTKAGAGTLTLNGATTLTNLTISAGTLTTASAAFNIAGNWSNSGTFTAGSGTVTFNGTSQTITGTTTFNNFTVNAGDTVTFPSTLTQTFNGTFTAIGTLGSIITINASSLGSAATLSSAGTISCDYLSVADSAAVGGANWQAGSHSTKSGNDVSGWIFPVTTTAPTVTTASSSPISDTSATLNGNITATGGANATVRGFAYGTDSTLTIVIATTTETGSFGTGAYTYFVFSLSCGTTYYSRAYATNSGGTGFGSIVSFITSSCSLSPPVIKFLNGVIKFLNGSIKVL